jgi:ATP-dependent DNA helicase RecG
MRSLYKFTKIYSGDEPGFVEGDVFRTIVPLGNSHAEALDKVDDAIGNKLKTTLKTAHVLTIRQSPKILAPQLAKELGIGIDGVK